MKRHLLAGLLLCLASTPLLAVEDPEQLRSLKQAAESGNISAQYDLGVLYEFGYRMKTHLIPALAWYMVAADNGDARATKRRDYLMSQLTPDQVEKARSLRAGFGAKKPAGTPPAGEPPAARPTDDKPAPAPAPPAAEAPKPAAPVAKPAEKRPEPKAEEKEPAPAKPSGENPTVQPLLPPPAN